MTQEQLIPGLGNSIARGILFRSRLHPRHPISDLSRDQRRALYDAIILWATIDPISTLLVFALLTADRPQEERASIALRATVYAGIVLIGSIVIGQLLLAAMGISMVAFQLSGGIVLFLFSLRFIFGGLSDESASHVCPNDDIAVFPLAIPTIATPGAILAVIVLTDNHLYPLAVQFGTAIITISILVASYAIMLASRPAMRVLRKEGAAMLVRVIGLILAALSVQLVLDAVAAGEFLL